MKSKLASITVKQLLMILVITCVMFMWVLTCVQQGELVVLPDISILTDIIGGMSDSAVGEFM